MNRLTFVEKKQPLQSEAMINVNHIRWIKFYPYEDPSDQDNAYAACEIFFHAQNDSIFFFNDKAQIVYNEFAKKSDFLALY